MISYLLGTERREERLEDVILQRAEGIPFFIEEFVRSLKELKTIREEDHKGQRIGEWYGSHCSLHHQRCHHGQG